MTLDEIKYAVKNGKTVHWANEGYIVCRDSLDQWNIICTQNNNCIGLTHKDGITLNGSPDEFFIESKLNEHDQNVIVNMIRNCGLRTIVDAVAIATKQLLEEGYFKNEFGDMDDNEARIAINNLQSQLF
jgi:hypothetical protein